MFEVATSSTICDVVLLLAGKLDFSTINPHATYPTRFSKEPELLKVLTIAPAR